MHHAIIDLGTNTCNLLIASTEGKQYKILYSGKEGVKLGKEGINQNILSPEAFERAAKAISSHLQIINRYAVDEIIAIATSAVRDAVNRDEFARYIFEKTGLSLTIISGEEEAEYIFKGVRLAFGTMGNSLILDIGGGSNEFILTHGSTFMWRKSFPIGMSRIISRFPISDPISSDEIQAIEKYFDKELEPLWERLDNANVRRLIGCSGAFDTIADIIDNVLPDTKFRVTQEIKLEEFNAVSEEIICSTTAQREKMSSLEPLRIEMIVPSCIFIRFILNKLSITEIIQTGFSLKEGVLYTKINY